MADTFTLANYLQGRRNPLLDEWYATPPVNTLTGDPVRTYPDARPGLQGYATTPSERGVSNWLADYAGAPRDLANRAGALAPWTPMGGAYDAGQMIGQGIDERNALMAGTGTMMAIFAGPMARTANLRMMRRAQAMHAAGRPRDDIWNDTGWFQGRDGQWRFEIDDSGSRITNEATAAAEYTGPRFSGMGEFQDNAAELPPRLTFEGLSYPTYEGPLSGGLHHADLYAAYPNMRNDLFTLRRADDANGSQTTVRGQGQTFAQGPTDASRQSVTLHEGQHRVQGLEGFDPSYPMGPESLRLQRELSDAIMAQVAAERPRSLWQRMFGQPPPRALPDSATDEMMARLERIGADEYRRQAAEVEARNVQTRMNMTLDDRRARPPWTTQDVPDDQQFLQLAPRQPQY